MEYCNLQDTEDLLTKLGDTRQIESRVIDFIVSARDQVTYSYNSLKLAAIMAFYSINDLQLNRKKLGKFLGEEIKRQKDRPYTLEEIHRMLDVADERGKAIILLLTSTGMRIGALSGLRFGHLQRIDEYDLYKVTVYENTKDEYTCFTSPEAATALNAYLQQIERRGEKISYDKEKKMWSPGSSPLFRREYDKDDPFKIRYARPVTKSTFDYILQQILEKAGVITITPKLVGRKTVDRKPVARSNGFRKMVNTTMVKAHVKPLIKEMLLGHHTGLEENYYRPEEQDLLNEYLKCVDMVTVNQEHMLRREIKTLKQEVSRFDKMEKQIQELTKKLGLG
jgi:integrase